MTVKRSRWWSWDSPAGGPTATASRATRPTLDIRDRQRSAGTFGRKKDAEEAWKNAEAAIRAGKRGDPSRGKRLFEDYVLAEWLPHHQLEPGVRSEYARQIRKHLLSFF